MSEHDVGSSQIVRREFLTGVAAVLGGASAVARQPQIPPMGLIIPRRRVSVYDPAAPLEDYARGVAQMKKWSAANKWDPRGWDFQAAIHGIAGNLIGGLPPSLNGVINGCQHGNWLFVVWHRAYLFYFESIMKVACGNPGFALPYWDWDHRGRDRLPPEFVNEKSALFVGQRRKKVNEGKPLASSELDAAEVLRRTEFVPRSGSRLRGDSFGGGPGVDGYLELHPHNTVHVLVGGPGGLMNDPDTAALDPIFWPHHANVDRLWEAWQAHGNQNPADQAWLKATFNFVDGSGQIVRAVASDFAGLRVVAGREIVEYDDLEGIRPALLASKAFTEALKEPQQRLAMQAPPKQNDAKAALFQGAGSIPLSAPPDMSVVLGEAPVRVKVEVPQPKQATFAKGLAMAAAMPAEAPRVLLTVNGFAAPKSPGVVYRIYVNPKAEVTAATGGDNPGYVGTIAQFGATKPGGHGHGDVAAVDFSFDITSVLNREARAGALDPKMLDITFVAVGVGGDNKPAEGVSYKSVTLSLVD